MEELKGFDFRIFWAMAVHKRAVILQQLNSIKLHPYEHKPSNVEVTLNTLLKNDYITETKEKNIKRLIKELNYIKIIATSYMK